MDTAFKRDLRNYPLYFLLWTVLGLFYFTQGVTQRLISHDSISWWRYLVAWIIGVYIWAILTPVILWLGRRFPLERGSLFRQITRHFFLSALFSAFELAFETVVYLCIHLFPSANGNLRGAIGYSLIRGFHGGILNYWTVLGVQWGVVYYRRYRERSEDVLKVELRASELQSQLASAQLSALKMQLQPHFLFNTLNAITVLVRQQKSNDAEQMLGYLSDLLRVVLEDMDAQVVSLRRELDYLQLYLAIEQVRFQDRLRVQLAIDPVTQDALVPQLILQPIVENAIRHGIGRSSSAGQILIGASKIDDAVELRVQDDGPGLSSGDTSNDRGIGLANTRARLEQLYGRDARLEIGNCERRGVVVTMTIPFHQSPAETLKTYDSKHSDR